MPIQFDRIRKRLLLSENTAELAATKDIYSPTYDRQRAENLLFHTIGPLTDSPRFVTQWTSPGGPPPGFVPGGTSPRWTPEEVTFAMAGDPNELFKDNPRSPSFGNRGGSPLWRLAKRVAKQYARGTDKQFISDLYSNGFVPLTMMMKPGFDASRSPFISYAITNIEGAMRNGVGGDQRSMLAIGGEESKRKGNEGMMGLNGLLNMTDGNSVRKHAQNVKGKYQSERYFDKHPDNPFGHHSVDYFRAANKLADALDSGDETQVDAARQEIEQIIAEIEDAMIFVPGASTGMGQAISTPDRKTSIGVASMDAPKTGAEGQETSMAANISGPEGSKIAGGRSAMSWLDPEAVNFILDQCLKHDFKKILGPKSKFVQMAGGEVGGVMTATEFRYAIRYLGHFAAKYPGKGTMRTNLAKPRDAVGWWKPYEDPEIEPIPNSNEIWTSLWVRRGNPQLGPEEIAKEQTEEFLEFQKLKIPSNRKATTKKDGKVEVTSKVAVNTAFQNALTKLKIAAYVNKGSFSMDESSKKKLRAAGVELFENWDRIDVTLLFEACNYLIHLHSKFIVENYETKYRPQHATYRN